VTSHHAFMGQGCGFCGKLSRLRRATVQQTPQPRRRLGEINNSEIHRSGARGTRLGKLYLLDTGLLMGGTEMAPKQLIKRVYEVDPLLCPKCGGEMRIIAFIIDHDVVDAILRHHAKAEARSPRGPPSAAALPAAS